MNERELFIFLRNKGQQANKSLGQHFLINLDLSKKIIEALEIKKDDQILEIGAGFAALSYFLAEKPAHLTLLDIDNRVIEFLNNLFNQNNNIKVVKENILQHDIESYDLIVGNVPYYLTKRILEHVLLNTNKTRRTILMLQEETSEKLFTKTGDKDFNPLAILVSYLGTIKKVLNVSKNNFSPPPKVDSAVVQIDFLNKVQKDKLITFYNFLNRLFMHKRKTIHNNLSKVINDVRQSEEMLQIFQIDKNKRPHELTLEEFLLLFNNLDGKKDRM